MRAEPDAVRLWADGQRHMVALGRTLDDDQADLVTPACPDWTVRDVYAHQAGVSADILAGRMDGVATDQWTSRQVAERSDRSLSEILDEWDGDAPLVLELLTPVAEHIDPRFLSDQWTHHQDVRGAVGSPGDRDDGRARFLVQRLVGVFTERVARADLDPVVVDVGPGEAATGADRVRVDAFEFARAGVGRRSPAQMAAWDWSVSDPGAYIELLPVFTARTTDLLEPA